MLVTHQLQYLKAVEHLVLMQGGYIVAQGSYNHVRSTFNNSFFDSFNEETSKPEITENYQPIRKDMQISSVAPSSNSNQEQSPSDYKAFNIFIKYFQFANNPCFVGLVIAIICIAPIANNFVILHIAKWYKLKCYFN